MSFSSEVKQELQEHISNPRHCRLAELAAIICFCGHFEEGKAGKSELVLHTENDPVVRKCFTLWKKTFNIDTDIAPNVVKEAIHYRESGHTVSTLLLKHACCKRAYLRGAFLCVGSISDPEKGYHLELVCDYEDQALQLQEIMNSFELDAKIVMRKKYHVVYVKEGAGIVDFLNITEAHISLMKLENLRIVKEMRNSINRRVNCEAANITKTVHAATKQIEDILYIREHYGFDNLPDNLAEMAEIRLEHQDAALKELGQYLDPPVGKSGVNHRLRKLSELADRVRA